MGIDGDCLEPLLPNGGVVVVKKAAETAAGDVVLLWPLTAGRPAWLKRLTTNLPTSVKKFPYRDHPESEVKATVMLEQLNPRLNYTVSCDKIYAMHKAIGFVPPGVPIGGKIKEGRPPDWREVSHARTSAHHAAA